MGGVRAPGDREPEGSKFTHRKKTNRTKRPPFKVSSSGRGPSAGRYDSLCLQIPACYGHSFSLTCGVTYRDTHTYWDTHRDKQTHTHTQGHGGEWHGARSRLQSHNSPADNSSHHGRGEGVQADTRVLSHPALPCKPHPSPPLDRAANLCPFPRFPHLSPQDAV